MDTNSFIVYIKTDGLYRDIADMLKQGLIIEIVNQIDHSLKEKIKKNYWINER